jgi:nicotinamidase-related amidase
MIGSQVGHRLSANTDAVLMTKMIAVPRSNGVGDASSTGAGPAMADNLSIDRRTSALLVMDFQTLIVDNYAAGAEALLDRTAKLIAVARAAGIRVIYVVVGFRPGYPEVSDRNATFNGLKASGAFAAGAENAKIHPAVAPLVEEIVVTKHRVSAFAGTDLDMVLRANGIETLILTGIATSGVVLSTLRQAADADYRLLLGRRRGSASRAAREDISAPGHHHDGSGTRARHRDRAVDAVTASCPPAPRIAL